MMTSQSRSTSPALCVAAEQKSLVIWIDGRILRTFSFHLRFLRRDRDESFSLTNTGDVVRPDTVMGRRLRFFFRSYLHLYICYALLSNSFNNGVPRCDLVVWMLRLSPVKIKSNAVTLLRMKYS